MARLVGSFLLCALLAACTTAPVVYAPDDLRGGPATGAVPRLRDMLPIDRPIRLVFLHGVGDHCYGYALNPNDGWLNDEAAKRLGFTPLNDLSPPRTIFTNVFMGGPRDHRSFVQYATRLFRFKMDGMHDEVRVEAIEITWSHTTQWIKSNYLAYDSPSVTPAPGGKSRACIEAPDKVVPDVKPPPSRLLLSRVIKEQVFDRNLADAILYSGSYGAVMERGIAEALCHLVTGIEPDKRCIWPAAGIAGKDSFAYVFVTHSLGSRLIYDTILHLLGYSTSAKANPFQKSEWESATPFISNMLINTPAFYMMANQISLLGLANVPTDAHSTEVLWPLDVRELGVDRMNLGERNSARPARRIDALQPRCPNILTAVGDARARASAALGLKEEDTPELQMVAFNDTNDLLTWHIPSWYVNPGQGQDDCRPRVKLVNVFVQNTTPLLIIESPVAAHSNYFRNSDVWDVMSCGAMNGALSPCRR